MIKKLYFTLIYVASLSAFAQNSTSEIISSIQKLTVAGSVLYVAAHPDDENTELLAWFANEKKFKTSYLSITRGDGGQNLIGNEQKEKLGLIRTQELLAARRTDGASQYFTRAVDFGYSKNPEETFRIWNKDSILADVVWVIRNTKPDIIICRFPTDGGGGHGHHTASAILAEEAFEKAADPKYCPFQLTYVSTWQAQKVYFNSFEWGRTPGAKQKGELMIDVGTFNPILGKSYSEIAAESRSMHKSQGFGSAKWRGNSYEYFKPTKGKADTLDMFSGINTSISRISNSEKYVSIIQKIVKNYNPIYPQNIISDLTEAYKEADKFSDPFWKEIKKKELEQLVLACMGAHMEATCNAHMIVPGSKLRIEANIVKRNDYPLVLEKWSINSIFDTSFQKELKTNSVFSYYKDVIVPVNQNITNPYWLANKSKSNGLFNVNNQLLIGKPFNDADINVVFSISLPGLQFNVTKGVSFKWVEPSDGEKYRQLIIAPPVYLDANSEVVVFTEPDKSKEIKVTLTANVESVSGILKPVAPRGWKCEPNFYNFNVTHVGDQQVFSFKITPAGKESNGGTFRTNALIKGKIYHSSVSRISYPHIPIQTLQSESDVKFVYGEIKKSVTNIGYIPGAGDNVASCLEQIGCKVTILNDDFLSDQSLSQFDAIVVGIRAYNTNEKLKQYYSKLMEYVSNGGTIVAQYNTANWIQQPKADMGPYPLKIGRDRVTDEDAKMEFVNPNHFILNKPNKISATDFDGWIQERGLYYASEYDSNYEEILSSNDPNEKPLKGGLLIAKYGKGYYIYTGLAFFRQLPAGVPGAYRLFANLISAGK
ncbi:MAG: PIG-L family deacetylase [Bacteroidota bacterium]|nr:PIG-L family deacetylase [Bacteroidota bacterium]